MNRLINVSNRLPVTVGEIIQKSSGGLVAALEGLDQEYALEWLGWPGAEIPRERQHELTRILETQYQCKPIFLSQREIEGFYLGFANSSLWPLLHYMPTRFKYEPAWWEQYRTVNRKFADKVLEVASENDLVWVHDYQLMLVPAMLREAMPSLRVGFFLHTPFPSYEVFRCHPRRGELLRGMLGANQIGFHTFGYLRHFRSAVLRLLGIESEMMQIRHAGHMTALGIYPIGINAKKFDDELRSPAFAERYAATKSAHEGVQVVLSVERLDYTKGLLERLDAIDQFLSKMESTEKIKFIFISVPSREDVKEYRDLLKEVEGKIGQLDGKYATVHNTPIRFIHSSIDFTELCALYATADVALVTPLIDGMNLVAKEYVACQREHPGVLILSEFAGAAAELFNAVIVNPYDTQALVEALSDALVMPPERRRARMEPMRRRVMSVDAAVWARSFIRDLASRQPMIEAAADLSEARRRIKEAMNAGRRMAFFLDYDGTLRELERDPDAARPTPAVTTVLDELAKHPNIDVTIVSGRTSDDLEAFLGDYPFGLVAEHGASVCRAGSEHWERLDQNINYAWKDELLKVLRLYEQTTPGSFIEVKRTSLVWHYRRADPEFGSWKARELMQELSQLVANMPLQVRHGRKIVEITDSQISKGSTVARLLEGTSYGLVLVAGDDQTDESMFKLEGSNLVSMKVGDGETVAQYRVGSPARFRAFLIEALTRSGSAAVPQFVGG